MRSRFVRLGLVVAVALVLGALTSVGQGHLPPAVSPVANSAGSWSLVAFGLAWLVPGRWSSALAGGLSLVGLLVGYDATSVARGFAVSPSHDLFWGLAAVTVGPALGLAAHALAGRAVPHAALGAAVPAGLLAGEGCYYLVVVAGTTSPGWGITELVLAVAGPAEAWRSGRLTTRGLVAAYAVGLALAAAFLLAYRSFGLAG